MNGDVVSEIRAAMPAAPQRVSRSPNVTTAAVPLFPETGSNEHASDEQSATWLSAPHSPSSRSIRKHSYSGGTWRIIVIFGGLSLATPMLFFTAPAMITLSQMLLGCGLATVTWMIVKYPTEKAKERLSSDRVQPEMHLVLGTLLPELAVNLEKLLLWIDLTLRRHHCPVYVRYPVLNLVAWCTGPLWFSILMIALVFFLLVVTVISFGLILPFTLPLVGLVLGYSLMIPLWVFSVYLFSACPIFLATCIGTASEALMAWRDFRDQARARRMIKQRPAEAVRSGPAQRAGSPAAQRNPNPGQPWLTKKELLALYQQRGLLDTTLTGTAAPPPSAAHGQPGSGPASAAGPLDTAARSGLGGDAGGGAL